jgi:hypothetical protein
VRDYEHDSVTDIFVLLKILAIVAFGVMTLTLLNDIKHNTERVTVTIICEDQEQCVEQ